MNPEDTPHSPSTAALVAELRQIRTSLNVIGFLLGVIAFMIFLYLGNIVKYLAAGR